MLAHLKIQQHFLCDNPFCILTAPRSFSKRTFFTIILPFLSSLAKVANPDPPPAATGLFADFFYSKEFLGLVTKSSCKHIDFDYHLGLALTLDSPLSKGKKNKYPRVVYIKHKPQKIGDKGKNQPKVQILSLHDHHHQDKCSDDCSLEMRWLWPRAVLQLCGDVTLSHRPPIPHICHFFDTVKIFGD